MKSNEVHKEVHKEFWELAEEYHVGVLTLCQTTNVPIKVLLSWCDNETTPQSALDDLKRFLAGARDHE